MTVDARTMTPVEVVNACLKAHRATDWDGLRALFHREARIGVFAGGGEPGDPEQAIADMQRVHKDVVYQASVSIIRQFTSKRRSSAAESDTSPTRVESPTWSATGST